MRWEKSFGVWNTSCTNSTKRLNFFDSIVTSVSSNPNIAAREYGYMKDIAWKDFKHASDKAPDRDKKVRRLTVAEILRQSYKRFHRDKATRDAVARCLR